MIIHRLVQQIGITRCRQLLIGRQKLTLQYALHIGLIDEISDDINRVNLIIPELSPLSNKEFAIRRQLMLEAVTTTFEEALGSHLAACDRELRRLSRLQPIDPRE
jgi:isomerase DpgB